MGGEVRLHQYQLAITKLVVWNVIGGERPEVLESEDRFVPPEPKGW